MKHRVIAALMASGYCDSQAKSPAPPKQSRYWQQWGRRFRLPCFSERLLRNTVHHRENSDMMKEA